jgi:hypothetical protein
LIPSAGRLVVDGFVHGRDGAWIGPLPFAYEGDGVRLRDAGDPSGVSYNGVAHQAYRGSFSTPAAILQRQGADSFQVAHLESGRESPRVYLAVYGPGGKRLHRAAVATPDVPTGDRAAIARMFAPGAAPTFGPREAPIALLGAGDSAVVIAPLPRVVVAIGLPRGREIWRRGSSPGGRALLADLDGGGPALLMATGAEILAMDPWSGRDLWTLPFAGVPVAAGDPFGSGFVHLFSSTGSTLEVWRGQKCLPGLMQWSGLRGDLWRTGTLRPDGTTVGPI